jgi:hypothetical protein
MCSLRNRGGEYPKGSAPPIKGMLAIWVSRYEAMSFCGFIEVASFVTNGL